MKNCRIAIILTMATMACMSANAQVADTALTAEKGHIYAGDTRLRKSDLAGLEGFDMEQYRNGRAMYSIGVAFISVGAIPTLVSTYAMVANTINNMTADPDDDRPGSGAGQAIALFSGAAALVLEGIGIPLTCSGMKNIRSAANGFNGRHPVQVSLQPSFFPDGGMQPGAGLSLALRF